MKFRVESDPIVLDTRIVLGAAADFVSFVNFKVAGQQAEQSQRSWPLPGYFVTRLSITPRALSIYTRTFHWYYSLLSSFSPLNDCRNWHRLQYRKLSNRRLELERASLYQEDKYMIPKYSTSRDQNKATQILYSWLSMCVNLHSH